MGVGNRFKYKKRKDRDGPPPGAYELKSQFSKTPNGNAYSFGMSREVYQKVYVKENP
jgi:hypothetical protein